MYLAYIDESGNIGTPGSRTYAFDQMIDFRRFLFRQYGVPVRAEIKANFLIYNKGVFRRLRLSESARFSIYRGLMRLQSKLDLQAFAVVIHKQRLDARGKGEKPRDVAWEFLMQRVERLTTTNGESAMIVHDEGEGAIVRKICRKARRAGSAGSAFGTGTLKRPARLLVDDPVPRDSSQSYFVQLADLTAYAAFRRLHPPPARGRPDRAADDVGRAWQCDLQ